MSLDLDKTAWRRVKFGDVVRNVNNTAKDPWSLGIDRVIAMEHMDPGELGIERWGDVADGRTFTRVVTPGQTLFGKRRAYQRKVAYAEFDAICSGDIYTFEAIDGELVPELLPFLVQSERFFDHALGTSAGSLSPRTNWRDLANFEFDLPPTQEQERLAELMWAVERHRMAARKARAQMMSVQDRFLADWWESIPPTPIGSIGVCVTGSTPSKSVPTYWDTDDVPFYTPTEIAGSVVESPRQWVSEAGATQGRLLPENSVLVACIGGDMGKAAVLNQQAVTNQQITAVTGLDSNDAYLLRELLIHPRGRQATASRETTTIVRKLNKSDLMKVEVPWGPGRDAASQLAAAVRLASAQHEREMSSLRALHDSLLNEIFGGI